MASLRSWLSAAKTAVYRQPKDAIKRLRRWGPRAYLRCGAWQKQMERQATHLPPLSPPLDPRPLEVWCLTGERFWYQTLFCAYSLATTASRPLVLHLIDDGSLTSQRMASIRAVFPNGGVRFAQESLALLEQELPAHRYGGIHRRWHSLMVFRKLTDVHLGNSAPRVFLDSDMLFWRRPDALLDWYDRWIAASSPKGFTCCFMTDCIESYGYPVELMASLAGHPVPRLLNTGVNGIHSALIDWDELEHWIESLEAQHGTSYYLEQALFSMVSSRTQVLRLPAETYVVSPERSRAARVDCALQHYVYDSKPHYFSRAWRQWLHRSTGDRAFP